MNEDLADNSRKEWVRLLYTEHDVTIKDIALKTGVDEACVRNWISAYGWDNIRRSLLTSKDAQLKRIYNLLETLNDKMNNAPDINVKDVELYLKYVGAIKGLEGDINTATVVQVGAQFINWLRQRDLSVARLVGMHYDAYISYLSSPLNQ